MDSTSNERLSQENTSQQETIQSSQIGFFFLRLITKLVQDSTKIRIILDLKIFQNKT